MLRDWLNEWWLEVVQWFESLFQDFKDFMYDLFVTILEQILLGVLSIIDSLEPPEFLENGLDAVFGGLNQDVLYLLNAANFFEGLTLIGSAYTFRLVRKLVTLFQW